MFGFSVPYLVSRPDPWDKASPYHRWGPVLLGARTVQAKLGADARVARRDRHADTVRPPPLARACRRPPARRPCRPLSSERRSGFARRGSRSACSVSTGRERHRRLRIGAAVSPESVAASTAARLASSPDGATWTPAGAVSPDTRGRDLDRGEAGADDALPARGRRARVARAARAGLAASSADAPTALEPTVLRGTVRPRIAGAVVAVERRKGTSWVTLGEATVDAAGAFALELDARAGGRYRARISATAGFAAGRRRCSRCRDEARRAPRRCVVGAWLALPPGANALASPSGSRRRPTRARRRRDRAANRNAAGEPRADPGTARRAPGRNVAARYRRHPLRRAARDPPPRLHAERPARLEAVVPHATAASTRRGSRSRRSSRSRLR